MCDCIAVAIALSADFLVSTFGVKLEISLGHTTKENVQKTVCISSVCSLFFPHNIFVRYCLLFVSCLVGSDKSNLCDKTKVKKDKNSTKMEQNFFDIEKLHKNFTAALNDDTDVTMDFYLDGFKELSKCVANFLLVKISVL